MLKKNIFFILLLAISISAFANEKNTDPLKPKSNQFWWPNMIDLEALRQHNPESSPLDKDFDYAKAFSKIDLKQLKADIEQVMKTSQDWWPADYGHYGPFFIRMAWHSAGTYRTIDGRGGAGGGQQRFEPLNSWPDNANLDKARRLLWPIKKKYGQSLSWADLMVLTGNVALESMGFETLGFAGGRTDDWEADMVYWGPETTFLASKRHHGKTRTLKGPLAATQMGLIYVNPEGPNGNGDPISAAKNIRETFGRMAMNDEETVALIAGGHTFGKGHGAKSPEKCVGPAPTGEKLEAQGFGWKNKCGKGNAEDTITAGLEGAWSSNPIAWTSQYLDNLFAFDWVKKKQVSGGTVWVPINKGTDKMVPDAHDKSKRHAPIMFTTDMSLKFDPEYKKIALRFQKDPKAFANAFAHAWFKLTHRDMGPSARYVGSDIPKESMIWQDPIPKRQHKLISSKDIKSLKKAIKNTKISSSELVRVAWAAASTFRATDMRGGANGARLSLAPQNTWVVNEPKKTEATLNALKAIQAQFNKKNKSKPVSLADLIVLAGSVGIEMAANKGGHSITVPFAPGRMDASQEQTDVEAFAVLEPKADGFRNYYAQDNISSPIALMIDKSATLDLSAPEMTVLLGGLRVMAINTDDTHHGVLTQRKGILSNDFFINLLDMSTQWEKAKQDNVYVGVDRKSKTQKWTATSVDLMFGSSSELRAIAEVYASDDAKEKFVQDFVKAWVKVMELDRFDLAQR
ncbi:MAG TPA: catalase/peroxidase HPI [Oligoflexia bacterium]|nr:catalase/peroxidase HPI [Oligoflexia bacterium]HMR25509.1 catalase/peroxidase HPI [Oligoflexia bacterium]